MIRAQWQRVVGEWRQSRRLRLGALVIVLVLGFHAVMTLSDRQQVAAEQYRRDAALLARLQEASRESAWPERATQAEAALGQLRGSVPVAANEGLAQAELQAWLAGQAAAAGLETPRVRAEATLDVPGQPELWQVVARLDAQVPPGRMAALLQAVSTGLPWIMVERLDITDGRQTQLGMIVRGYYRKPAAASDPAQETAANAPAAVAAGGQP